MELVTGYTLREAIKQNQINPAMAVWFVSQIGEALAIAHEKDYVHRDVKPDNILIDEKRVPKLIDFDLVRTNDSTGNTESGEMGTFMFASPETRTRPQHADGRADIFSLGMTLLFCLLGEVEFNQYGPDPQKVVRLFIL